MTIAIDLYNKKIHFLDPMKKGKYPVATTIVTRLLIVLCELEVIRQKFSELNPSWHDYVVVQEKLQNNGHDCGIFVLLFSELFARQIQSESYDMYPKYLLLKNIDLILTRASVRDKISRLADWRSFLKTYAVKNHLSKDHNFFADICSIEEDVLKEQYKPQFFEDLYDPVPAKVYIYRDFIIIINLAVLFKYIGMVSCG